MSSSLIARVAKTVAEAVSHADAIGYPVVLVKFLPDSALQFSAAAAPVPLENASAVAQAFDRMHASIEHRHGAGSFRGVFIRSAINPYSGSYP